MRSATGTVRWIKARHRREPGVAEAPPMPAAAFGVARIVFGPPLAVARRRR